MGDAARPTVAIDEQLLMAEVARRYFWEGRTRVQIATEFGLSRFKVARLIEAALRTGIVRIEIAMPQAVDAELSVKLRERYGLDRALVTTTAGTSPEVIRDALGAAAARLLGDLVGEGDVLGVTSGRTIDATVRHLTSLAGCEIVQLTGMSGNLDENSVEVLRRVAAVSGGAAHSMYAPLTVSTPEAAAALRADPRVRQAYARFGDVTIALVAVGCWSPADSRFHDEVSDAHRSELLARGVIADVGGALIDAAGRPVTDFDDRVLGLTVDQLAAIDQVIVVGGGERKAPAILATLRAGIVNTLITDGGVARYLLAD